MTWDDFCTNVKKTAEKAADQINYSTDLATLQVKLSLAEQKLEKAYAALGKTAYQHFSKEENTAEAVAKAMLLVEEEKKAVQLLKHRIAALKKKHSKDTDNSGKETAKPVEETAEPKQESADPTEENA